MQTCHRFSREGLLAVAVCSGVALSVQNLQHLFMIFAVVAAGASL